MHDCVYHTESDRDGEEFSFESESKVCHLPFQVRKCYRPLEKRCTGEGLEECRTVYESSCTTKYVEKEPGKFVGDTRCEKLPVEVCGAGCSFEEGEEECHDKEVDTPVNQPEEHCDLSPQRVCHQVRARCNMQAL